MNYLLDTNVFIWWNEDPGKLSDTVRAIFADSTHTRYLSIASVWEMQIKVQIGKLDLQVPLSEMVHAQMRYAQLHILPVSLDHIYALNQLAIGNHRDPFDRLLIAQAVYEQWPILSYDSQFSQYPIQVIR